MVAVGPSGTDVSGISNIETTFKERPGLKADLLESPAYRRQWKSLERVLIMKTKNGWRSKIRML